MPLTWADVPVDGDYVADNDYYRILYDAFAEREKSANGSRESTEEATGYDPIALPHAYPAAADRIAFSTSQGPKFGGFAFLQRMWLRRDGFTYADNVAINGGQFANNAWGNAFIRKGFVIDPTDNPDGSDWNDQVVITAAFIETIVGTIERKVPRRIASLAATVDQVGNARAVGHKAYCKPSGECQRVYQFDGANWILQPQSARPDRLSSSSGEIPLNAGSYKWHFQEGDYFGLHLFRQLRLAYKELGKLMTISDPVTVIDSWSERSIVELGVTSGLFLNPDAAGTTHARFNLANGSAHSANSPPTPTNFSEMQTEMNTSWDSSADFGVAVTVTEVHTYSWSHKRTDGSDTAWDAVYRGQRGELKYTLGRHVDCEVKTYGFTAQSDFADAPGPVHDLFSMPTTVVFDDYGHGFTANQWDTILSATVPSHATPTTLYESGVEYGKSWVGDYPTLLENTLDADPTARGFHIPIYVSVFNYFVVGGYQYQ